MQKHPLAFAGARLAHMRATRSWEFLIRWPGQHLFPRPVSACVFREVPGIFECNSDGMQAE
jgi:hypothetical protein